MEAQRAGKPDSRSFFGDELVLSLSRTIEETLARVLGGAKSCLLMHYPNDVNVGDNAIWLGQRTSLRAKGVRVSRYFDNKTYERDRVAATLRRHPEPILLQGGGDLGDVWTGNHQFRERVIEDFRDNPIIQLPQSIHFRNRDSLDRTRRIFDSHPTMMLLVRDRQSLEIARREFQAASYLCPDMAFALGPLNRPPYRKGHIVWLRRTDLESAHEYPQLGDPKVEVVDWAALPPPTRREPLALAAHRIYEPSRQVQRTRRKIPRSVRALSGRSLLTSVDILARRRLTRGLQTIGSAEAVVTDRLHGHILSLLMGIPHVLLDNNYGKVSSFHETWTKGWENCSLANGTEEAWQRVREMLQSHGRKDGPE